MPEVNNTDAVVCWLIGILAVIILALLILNFAVFISDFSQELKYLNHEVDRTQGNERAYWLRRRRRLWLSLIPFVKY